MLREGMLVKVEGGHLHSFLYEPIIGKIGTVIEVRSDHVRIAAPLLGRWLIHKEDAIPYVVQHNKEACQLLQKEEKLFHLKHTKQTYEFPF